MGLPLRYTYSASSAELTTIVIGPSGLRSGLQSYSSFPRRWSISGEKSLGARSKPGFEARCGVGVLPSPTTTVPPLDVALNSNCEKSYGNRTQPWLAG